MKVLNFTVHYDFYINDEDYRELTISKKSIYKGVVCVAFKKNETYAKLAHRIYQGLRTGQLTSLDQQNRSLYLKYFGEAEKIHDYVKLEEPFIALTLAANVKSWENRTIKSAKIAS